MSMFRINSTELKALTIQLDKGLINECEFMLALQCNENVVKLLIEFNALDAEVQDWKFTLDDFAVWRLKKHIE